MEKKDFVELATIHILSGWLASEDAHNPPLWRVGKDRGRAVAEAAHDLWDELQLFKEHGRLPVKKKGA